MNATAAAAAKLNWDLRVLGRRADGFHELRSWFLPLDWSDELRVAAAAAGAPRLALEGPAAAGTPVGADNLVLRAEDAWRAAFPTRAARLPPLRWSLSKRIPAGAGLGGGSADAAAALALLEGWAGARDADAARLAALAERIGSDLPFFLSHRGGAELRGGRGELLLARAAAPASFVVLAQPPFPLPTAEVYAALGAAPWTGGAASACAALPGAEPGPNGLALAAERLQPELAGWRAAAAAAGVALTMTGSGSAHFAAFAVRAEAEAACARLERVLGAARCVGVLAGPALRTRMEGETP